MCSSFQELFWNAGILWQQILSFGKIRISQSSLMDFYLDEYIMLNFMMHEWYLGIGDCCEVGGRWRQQLLECLKWTCRCISDRSRVSQWIYSNVIYTMLIFPEYQIFMRTFKCIATHSYIFFVVEAINKKHLYSDRNYVSVFAHIAFVCMVYMCSFLALRPL